MLRTAIALLACSAAFGQAPIYSAAGMVNATDYSVGPFAPNSVVAIFGSNLIYTSTPVAAPSGTALPIQLAGIAVYYNNRAVPLLYASDSQINFLIPSDALSGLPASIHIVRQSWTGPTLTIILADAAPCLFPTSDSYVLATDWNTENSVATPAAPAHPGDTIVLYATGLGHTQPNPDPGAIPATAASIENAASFRLLLNGSAIDPSLVKYAGIAPGWPGLYQINFVLPLNAPADPEIRVSLDGQTSAPGLKLAVAPAQ